MLDKILNSESGIQWQILIEIDYFVKKHCDFTEKLVLRPKTP